MNEKQYKSFENKQYYDCNRVSILKNKQQYYENNKVEIKTKDSPPMTSLQNLSLALIDK